MDFNRIDPSRRIITDYGCLSQLTMALKAAGMKIVVTIGTWDLVHVGHLRYVHKAAEMGDCLIVGADSDRAVKLYKEPYRPIVPQDERMELLTAVRDVSFVTIIDDVTNEGKWQYGLIEAIRPDVFVAVIDSYPEEQLEEIRQYCGEVQVLPRQAETSTSQQIRQAFKSSRVKDLEAELAAIKGGG